MIDFNLLKNQSDIVSKKICSRGEDIDIKTLVTLNKQKNKLQAELDALKNQKKGLDIEFSLKGEEINKFKNDINSVEKLKGDNFFFRSKTENKSKMLRRSIFVAKNIKKGEKFDRSNIRIVRPGNGLNPHYYGKLINKKSPKKLFKGEPLKKNILDLINLKKQF